MSTTIQLSRDSVVVLAKTGRLASWRQLESEERRKVEQAHVDLMLSVARNHHLRQMEGFKLIGPQERWERFWIIEFPDIVGAEAWIEAEMAPRYGLHGYYEYYLSRRWGRDHFATWVPNIPAPITVPSDADPNMIPVLEADRNSIVVLQFERMTAAAAALTPQQRHEPEHVEQMQAIAREHGLMRLATYQLIDPQEAWHRAWVIEFPTLAGAEGWIDGETTPPHANHANKIFYIARKWAPMYFASWVPQPDD